MASLIETDKNNNFTCNNIQPHEVLSAVLYYNQKLHTVCVHFITLVAGSHHELFKQTDGINHEVNVASGYFHGKGEVKWSV